MVSATLVGDAQNPARWRCYVPGGAGSASARRWECCVHFRAIIADSGGARDWGQCPPCSELGGVLGEAWSRVEGRMGHPISKRLMEPATCFRQEIREMVKDEMARGRASCNTTRRGASATVAKRPLTTMRRRAASQCELSTGRAFSTTTRRGAAASGRSAGAAAPPPDFRARDASLRTSAA